MNESSLLIKDIIKYLKDVYDGEKIEGLSQRFFISNKELDNILSEYFIFFKNENELLNDVRYNYNLIKDMSFPYQEGDYIYVRDLSIENIVYYSKEQHNSYSHRIHSHLIEAFEEKLGFKKERNTKHITIRNRRILPLLTQLNLKVEFLREDCSPEDFITVLTLASEKEIHLNIDNRNFHYLLTKIKDYFFNFTITAVGKTNKIHSKRGTLLKENNLINAKGDYPSLKDSIDEVFKNFK
jgi:hypothetical protein